MKTCLDDRSAFTKTVNMHYKDIKELTWQLLLSGQGVLRSISCKNGTLHPKMAIWSAQMEQRFTEGKCQPCVSVCGWDALLLNVWPLLLVMEDVLLLSIILFFSSVYNNIQNFAETEREIERDIWASPQRQRANICQAASNDMAWWSNRRWHFQFHLSTIWPNIDSELQLQYPGMSLAAKTFFPSSIFSSGP